MGATGGTIFLAEGSLSPRFFRHRQRKLKQLELLMINADGKLNGLLHTMIKSSPNKEQIVAFSIPFKELSQFDSSIIETDKITNHCIITIVDKGKGEKCIEAAISLGARDFLVTHGRGAGVPVDFYFPLAIEPEKEVVIILGSKEKTPLLISKITEELELEKVGNGIIFSLPVYERTNFTTKENR